MASVLKSAGYYTAHIGKWHLGFGREDDYANDREGQGEPNSWRSRKGGPDWNGDLTPGPLEVGFDYYFGIPIVNSYPPYVFVENHRVAGLDQDDPIGRMESRYLGEMQGGKAARWADNELATELSARTVSLLERLANQDQPFFLYYAPHQPHRPFTPNVRFKGASQFGVYGDFIQELDWSVGEVLDALARLGLAESTLVIFSSDNGGLMDPASSNAQRGAGYGDGEAPATPEVEHQANGPVLRGGKGDVWEGGHRIPFLARWPGKIKAGTRSGETISLTDMLATFAALAGQELTDDAGPDSFNVLPALLEGELDDSLRHPRVMQSGGISGMLAIREGPWKLIDGQGGGGYRDGNSEPRRASATVQLEPRPWGGDGRLRPASGTRQEAAATLEQNQGGGTQSVIHRERPSLIGRRRPMNCVIRTHLWAMLSPLLLLTGCESFRADRPNILWISLEDITPMMGAFGDEYARTPVFRRPRRRGHPLRQGVLGLPGMLSVTVERDYGHVSEFVGKHASPKQHTTAAVLRDAPKSLPRVRLLHDQQPQEGLQHGRR